MTTSVSQFRTASVTAAPGEKYAAEFEVVRDELQRTFGTDFVIWNGTRGEQVLTGQACRSREVPNEAELVRMVARHRRAEFVAETDGAVALALPVVLRDELVLVAVGVFAASWDTDMLLRLGSAVAGKLSAEAAAKRWRAEVDAVSTNLASTYEEISLLYTVTQNLRISRTDEELGQLAIDWLVDCIPAQSFAVLYLPISEEGDAAYRGRHQSVLISNGDCPVDRDRFQALVGTLELNASRTVLIANQRETAQPTWEFPAIRQLIIAPLTDGERVYAWLAAFNHVEDAEFGTVEANLLASLGSLLGIHCGNRELYRQQAEFLSNVVRALVSAIDAKDPYTSGHSDRVARYAVRLGLELRVNPKLLNTLYMSGLLHDIGKIGIDDSVLRKAGRLTEAEFEHIKTHPDLGSRILADLKQLSDVLPAVRHHHEQWDGQGYPDALAGEEIPRIARIMAVADAYDAMTSDRPYRAGMPEEKVDEIFRAGSGRHWDPQVIAAFFKAKSDIEEIRWRERSAVNVVDEQWV